MLCSLLLDAALNCLMAIKKAESAIEHVFSFRCCCALLGEMLDMFKTRALNWKNGNKEQNQRGPILRQMNR